MEVIGEDHVRIEFEGMRILNRAQARHKVSGRIIGLKDGPALIRHNGEEIRRSFDAQTPVSQSIPSVGWVEAALAAWANRATTRGRNPTAKSENDMAMYSRGALGFGRVQNGLYPTYLLFKGVNASIALLKVTVAAF